MDIIFEQPAEVESKVETENKTEVENEIKKVETEDSLTSTDKIFIEKARTLFYENGNSKEAVEAINNIYEKHPSNEELLNVYLPIIYDVDNNKAIDIIKNLKSDILMAYLIGIDYYIKSDLSEADRYLEKAEKLWKDNFLVQCRRIVWQFKMYRDTNTDSFYADLKNKINNFPEVTDKLEKSWKARCKRLLIQGMPVYSQKQCEEQDIYPIVANQFGLCDVGDVVNFNGDPKAAIRTISEAINAVKEGGTVNIAAGIYNEQIVLNRNVNLVGVTSHNYGGGPVVVDAARYKEVPVQTIISVNAGTACTINSYATISCIDFRNACPEADKTKALIEIYSNCKIDKCWVESDLNLGILISGNGITPVLNNITTRAKSNVAICIKNGAAPKMEDCQTNGTKGIEFYDTSAGFLTRANGTGNPYIHIHDNANPSVSGCNFSCSSKENGCYAAIVENNGAGNFSFACCDGIKLSDNSKTSFTDSNISFIECNDNTTASFNSCKFTNYSAEGSGAIIQGNANPTIFNSTFDSCNGFGLFISGNATGTYNNCTILKNKKSGILVRDNANPYMEDCTSDNNAGYGIYILCNATGTYKKLLIVEEKNQSGQCKIAGDANPYFEECKIYTQFENTINFIENCKGIFKKCIFGIMGMSKYDVISFNGSSSTVLEDCSISPAGASIFDTVLIGTWDSSTPTLRNCDIRSNESRTCNLLIAEKSNPTVENCVFHKISGLNIQCQDEATGTVKGCTFPGNTKNHPNLISLIDKAKTNFIENTISGKLVKKGYKVGLFR